MKKSNLIIILFSLLSGARLNLIGQLFGSEVIALIFFPYTKIKRLCTIEPIKKIIFPYILILISLMVSDIFVNGTSQDKFLRGWFNIIFSFIQVIFLVNTLLKDIKNYMWYLLFGAVSFFIFRPQMEGGFELESNAFKVYFMQGVNFIILYISYHFGKNSKKRPVIIWGLYAIFCMIVDARSNGAVFFLSALIYCIKAYKINLTRAKITMFSICLLFFSYFGYIYYISNIQSGKIGGENAKQVLKLKNPYNPFELLAVGRIDSLFTLIPILDKPFFGFGSWAEDSTGKYNMEYDKITDASSGQGREDDLIPAHSVVLATWLWGGIGGLIGICMLYFRVFKWAFLLYKKTNVDVLIIIVPLLLDQIWNFFFSPLGHIRQTSPFFFAIIIVEYYKYKQIKIREKKEKFSIMSSK